MFYLTLAIALTGTLTLVGSALRIVLLRREVRGREIRTAFRHAILFALVVTISLVLSRIGRFQTYHIIFLIAVASALEYFFLQFQRGRG